MLRPDEAARAEAEIELARFFDEEYFHDIRHYWDDLDITEERVAQLNAWAEESPEQATSYYFLEWPRWIMAAKAYAETVIKGIAATYLKADIQGQAVEAVSTFERHCEDLTRYLWERHFQSLAIHWNEFHRPRWQNRLPNFAVREITFDHFEIGMDVWADGDPYRPSQLEEDLIEQFWRERAKLAGKTVASKKTKPSGSFPRRSEWLKVRLQERAWNRNDPLRYRGPHPKTIDKILRGEGVREEVIEKLAAALSQKHSKVDLLDVPRD